MLISHPWSIRLLLCLVLGIFASYPAFAAKKSAEKWYEVEIIVFAHDLASNYEAEVWQDKPGFPNIRNNTEHFTPTELILTDDIESFPDYFIQPDFDPENEDTLEKYAQKLINSSKYKLLIHRSWRQTLEPHKIFLTDTPNTDPIDESKHDLPIDELSEQLSDEEKLLQALLKEEKDFSQPLSQLPFFISELDEIQPFDEVRGLPVSKYTPLSYEGPPQHLVYGNFTLSKGRYLHMDLDFIYRGEPYTTEEEISIEEQFPMGTKPESEDTVVETPTMSEELSGFIPKDKPPIAGFRIKDSKRVRLGRIYYSDHPLFGVVARVVRYTPPPPPEELTETKPQD